MTAADDGDASAEEGLKPRRQAARKRNLTLDQPESDRLNEVGSDMGDDLEKVRKPSCAERRGARWDVEDDGGQQGLAVRHYHCHVQRDGTWAKRRTAAGDGAGDDASLRDLSTR